MESPAERACRRPAIDAACASLLAVATAAVVVWQNSRLAVIWDLSYVLENATRMAAGDVPYRDFPFPYAPLTFLLQAAIIRVFGRHYALHVAYAAIAAGVATMLTYVIVRFFVRSSVAVILCAPLVLLGIYCVFPHPFYDPDCCLAILVALALCHPERERGTRAGGRRPSSARNDILFGFASVVPLFVKQNIGLPFLVAVIVVLLTKRNWRALIGVACGLAAAVAVIALTAGLQNYIRWTFRFAAERRLPSMADYFGVFNDGTLWWWLAVALVAIFFRKPAIAMIPVLWCAFRFFVTDDPLEPQENLLRLWPLMMVCSLFFIRRTIVVPVLAAILGAFLSQQTWGSTYGIWPLLIILIACVFDDHVIAAVVIASVMLLQAVPYVVNNERLTYAKVDETRHFLDDFRELVAWSDQHIPRDDAILSLPGEDLFYFTTGRRPRVPVLMFDRTINPYSAAEIAHFNVRWVIVKRTLQINGTPMPELPQVLALMKPTLVARLRNYDVYSHP